MKKEEIEQRLAENKQERKQLKQQLKDLLSLEVGVWYKYYGSLLCFKGNETTSKIIKCYGFCSGWDEAISCGLGSDLNKWTPATDKEVEEALIKEAKKRGFKEGVSFKNDTKEVWTMNGNIKFTYRGGVLDIWADTAETKIDGYISECRGFEPIFSQGKWAEIIQTKTVELNGNYTEVQLKDILNSQF